MTGLPDTLEDLQTRLGYRFRDPQWLDMALRHPSLTRGDNAARLFSYERLEFVGDRVVGLVVADLLYRNCPDEAEGDLARRHVALVRKETLAAIGAEFGLGEALSLSAGEDLSGGREKDSVLADAVESVIAAIYYDGGYDAARPVIEHMITPHLETATAPPTDPKTALQEWTQARELGLPVYTLEERTGPDHAPEFHVRVQVSGYPDAVATGPSKRKAEQDAAAAFFEHLDAQEAHSP